MSSKTKTTDSCPGVLSVLLAVLLAGNDVPPALEMVDMSQGVRDWFKRGEIHSVLGQEMFAVIEVDYYVGVI